MSTKVHKIGIILGSTRSPLVCPQIGSFITKTLTPNLPSGVEFSLIDLSVNPLPVFDEPDIPSAITETSGYTHAHTQAWSRLISSHNAFIFVTPQYNWGYPASLKNALDYLYGGHGGVKAAAQLRQVLEGGLKMRVVEAMPALAFPGREATGQAFKGEEMALPDGVWEKESDDAKRGLKEILKMLEEV